MKVFGVVVVIVVILWFFVFTDDSSDKVISFDSSDKSTEIITKNRYKKIGTKEIGTEEIGTVKEIGNAIYSAWHAFFSEGYVENWSFSSGELRNSLVFTLLSDSILNSGMTMKEGSNFYLWIGTGADNGGFDFRCSILLDSTMIQMSATGMIADLTTENISTSGSYGSKNIPSDVIVEITRRLLSSVR